MQLLKTAFVIGIVILVINFTLSKFNSEDGFLNSLKDSFYRYKISIELKGAKFSKQLSELLDESEKIKSDKLRIESKVSILKQGKYIHKSDADTNKNTLENNINNETKASVSQIDTENKKQNQKNNAGDLQDFQNSLTENIKKDIEKSLSKNTDAGQKDEFIRAIYNELEKNELLDLFYTDSAQNSNTELNELLYLNKILSLIKENKINEAKSMVKKIKDKDILGALSLLTKEHLTEDESWLLKVKRSVEKIETLLSQAKFLEAKAEIKNLKEFIKNNKL